MLRKVQAGKEGQELIDALLHHFSNVSKPMPKSQIPGCEHTFEINVYENQKYCTMCGYSVDCGAHGFSYHITTSPDPPKHLYRRITRMRDCIKIITGTIDTPFPTGVLKLVSKMKSITPIGIRVTLKHHGFGKYAYARNTLAKIYNYPIPELTQNEIDKLLRWFGEMENAWIHVIQRYNHVTACKRTTFVSYPLIIYKFSNMLNRPDVARECKPFMIRSIKLLHRQEVIFNDCMKYLNIESKSEF